LTTINVGFGKVLRVRWLDKSPKRRHLFVRRDDSPAALKDRHDQALVLLEQRRALRLAGGDAAASAPVVVAIEKRIRELGYRFADENAPDGRFSYWRVV
jgi:hypothetical protein